MNQKELLPFACKTSTNLAGLSFVLTLVFYGGITIMLNPLLKDCLRPPEI
jgi:hypothetical protein